MYETLQNNGRKYQPQLVSWISSITGWIVYLCIPWKKTENTHTHKKKTRTTFYSTSHYVTFSPLIFVKSFDDGLAVVCLNCPRSWIHKHNSFMVTCQNLYVKHPAWMAHQKHVFSNPIGFPWDERYICLHLPESTIHVGKYTTHGSYGNWFASWSIYSWIAKSRWDGRNTAKFKWNFRGFAWFLESRWCCERVVSWSYHPYVYHSLKLLVTFSPLKMDENGWLEDEISRDNPIFGGNC